ncbi:MAG: PsbP-related protein [Pyrinomonadaceae bacterium]
MIPRLLFGKEFFLSVLLLFAFCSIGFAQDAGLSTFVDKEYGYSVEYPSGWTGVTEPVGPIRIAIYRIDGESHSNFNINVIHWPMLEGMSSEEFVTTNLGLFSSVKDSMFGKMPNIDITAPVSGEIAGIPALIGGGTATPTVEGKTHGMKFQTVTFLKNGDVYTLTMGSDQSNFTQNLIVLNSIRDSFKFIPKAPVKGLAGF